MLGSLFWDTVYNTLQQTDRHRQAYTNVHTDKETYTLHTNKLRCSKHFPALDVVSQLTCKTKVNDLQSLVTQQHQVLRLQVIITINNNNNKFFGNKYKHNNKPPLPAPSVFILLAHFDFQRYFVESTDVSVVFQDSGLQVLKKYLWLQL